MSSSASSLSAPTPPGPATTRSSSKSGTSPRWKANQCLHRPRCGRRRLRRNSPTQRESRLCRLLRNFRHLNQSRGWDDICDRCRRREFAKGQETRFDGEAAVDPVTNIELERSVPLIGIDAGMCETEPVKVALERSFIVSPTMNRAVPMTPPLLSRKSTGASGGAKPLGRLVASGHDTVFIPQSESHPEARG